MNWIRVDAAGIPTVTATGDDKEFLETERNSGSEDGEEGDEESEGTKKKRVGFRDRKVIRLFLFVVQKAKSTQRNKNTAAQELLYLSVSGSLCSLCKNSPSFLYHYSL